jgi:lincosamide nucleotidyltransferase B/F
VEHSVDPASYQRFTETLTNGLSQYGDVLALVALGSMAARDHLPDRFSDHDFFVIVRPGTQSWYRENRQWLPEHHRIAFAYQETAHGVKVLYDDRHLLELAVFDPDELHQARINRYRVLFDRANLTATLEQLAAREPPAPAVDIPYHSGQLLTHLLVGLWRYQRGERLSAFRFLRELALQDLVQLTRALATADRPGLSDNLDPTRRFERIYPAVGDRLATALEQPILDGTAHLLDCFEHLTSSRTDVPHQVVAMVREELAAAGGKARAM